MAPLLTFVCWGNICRSPMGEQIARAWAQREGVDLRVDSAGVSSEEFGNPIDSRAARVLREHGYPTGNHRAQQVTEELIDDSWLVLAFEQLHVSRMRRIAPDAINLHLVTDFDPDAAPGTEIDDPWYGGIDGFKRTFAAIEAAMPAVIEQARQANL